jgi:hypothetical protein
MWKTSSGQIYEIEFKNVLKENDLKDNFYLFEYDDLDKEDLERFCKSVT